MPAISTFTSIGVTPGGGRLVRSIQNADTQVDIQGFGIMDPSGTYAAEVSGDAGRGSIEVASDDMGLLQSIDSNIRHLLELIQMALEV